MRWWALIATGTATVLLFLAMAPAEERMKENGPGMVPFELTGGQDRADEILAEWGEDGRDAARESLWIDFAFLLAYGAFLTMLLRLARDASADHGRRRLATIGALFGSFGVLVAGLDALENVCLLLTLDGAGAAFPVLATVFAACKFAVLAAAIGYLLAAAATWIHDRVRTPRASV